MAYALPDVDRVASCGRRDVGPASVDVILARLQHCLDDLDALHLDLPGAQLSYCIDLLSAARTS